jgi:hypothetical protein
MSHPYLAGLLDQFVDYVRSQVVFTSLDADAVALWNAHTYVYDHAPATPYLNPHSPEPGSGKTTLLDVLEVTARNAIQVDNLTEAALFRMIDKHRPTLLFDEIDAVFGKKHSDSTEGIRQVLGSGYRKGKKAFRVAGARRDELASFDVYCPKACAGLNQLPGTLAHRSVPIAMKPPRPDESYEDFDYEVAVVAAEPLRMSLQAWADEPRTEGVLRDPRLKPAKLPELDARGNEIWRILLRIADLAGGEWPERARAAALELSGAARRQSGASAAVQLLGHIRDLFDGDRMALRDLVEVLNGDDLPYGGWNEGKGISGRQLGKKLSPYGVLAKTVRLDGNQTARGYDRDQFEDAWARYLPEPKAEDEAEDGPEPPEEGFETGTNRHNPLVEPKTARNQTGTTGAPEADVPVSESGANPHNESDVPVCAGLGAEEGDASASEARPKLLIGDPGYALHVVDPLLGAGCISEEEAALRRQVDADVARALAAAREAGLR